MVYRFTHSIYYANAQQFSEEVIDLVNQASPPPRWLCLDAAAIDDVDFTAAETLRGVHGTLKGKGIRLVVAQVMEDKRQEDHYDLEPLLGEDAFYNTLEDVVSDFRRRVLKEA